MKTLIHRAYRLCDLAEDLKEELDLLRRLKQKPETSQRELASILGFSLGKLNYCLKSLQSKGLVKIKNFQKKTKMGWALPRFLVFSKGSLSMSFFFHLVLVGLFL